MREYLFLNSLIAVNVRMNTRLLRLIKEIQGRGLRNFNYWVSFTVLYFRHVDLEDQGLIRIRTLNRALITSR